MSSNSSSAAADIIASYAATAVTNYCSLAGIVFLMYAYTITIGREVELFWMRKFSGATLLFLANKHISLVNHLYDLAMFIGIHVNDKVRRYLLFHDLSFIVTGIPLQTCNIEVEVFSSVDWLQYVPWAAFSGLRVFALCRMYSVSVVVSVLSLVPLGVNFGSKTFGVNEPGVGCGMDDEYSPSMSLNVLLIMNVFHIVFSFASDTTSNVTLFTEPLTAVLTSHFLLDLQEASQKEVQQDDTIEQSMPSRSVIESKLSFTKVIGSLDSALKPGLYLGVDIDSEMVRDEYDVSVELSPVDLADPERPSYPQGSVTSHDS
ncbi:hypothetical protein BD311DRAFT_841061 [Dichomitus squalens]|uniref:DUF6533 domain-containing protein n=1 Tax=Dichomitus squalens TaxID=114155 RepID=A0A4V2K1V1_9APHY|nr:hypothetical protein BD311DRAFT_841061 [Dichomitus squalens]